MFQLANRTLLCLTPLRREYDLRAMDFPIRFSKRKTLPFSVPPQRVSMTFALTVALRYSTPSSKFPTSLAQYSPLMTFLVSDTMRLMKSSGVNVHGRSIGRETYGYFLYIGPPTLDIGYFVRSTCPPRNSTSSIALGIKNIGNAT
jgi:hypothetical protein